MQASPSTGAQPHFGPFTGMESEVLDLQKKATGR